MAQRRKEDRIFRLAPLIVSGVTLMATFGGAWMWIGGTRVTIDQHESRLDGFDTYVVDHTKWGAGIIRDIADDAEATRAQVSGLVAQVAVAATERRALKENQDRMMTKIDALLSGVNRLVANSEPLQIDSGFVGPLTVGNGRG